MKKLILSVISVLLIFSMCGCKNNYRVRLTLKPADYSSSEEIESSAKVLGEKVLPVLYPQFEKFECVKLGMYIQADMYTGEESGFNDPNDALKAAEKNFKSYWVKVCTSEDRVIFSSKNIKEAYFDSESANTPLVFKLDEKGTAALERVTLENQQQKLVVYLENSTIGEYTVEKWCADGLFCIYPDAVYSEDEQKELIAEIMSCAGLSGKYEIIDKGVS